MLYLEDYLELIEQLPQELRDRFTDIRERDLQVQNSGEQLNDKVKQFFAKANELDPDQKQCEYERLLKEYEDTMRYADDKVQIAEQTHEIMVTLVQRLEGELEKFKLELEADHTGITEELERRSLELDAEYRLHDSNGNHLDYGSNSNSHYTSSVASKHLPSGLKDRRRSEHKHHRHHPYHNNLTNGYLQQGGRAKLSQNGARNNHNPSKHHPHNPRPGQLNHSQGSVSPTQLESSIYSGPGTPAPNGYDYMEGGHYEKNLSSFSNNLGFINVVNKNNPQNSLNSPYNNHQHSALSAALSSPHIKSVSNMAMMDTTSVHNKISNSTNILKNDDLTESSSRYCLCRHVSYGEMVACDNSECEIEWFHYDCVGITQPPKGKWFCPECTKKMAGHHQLHHQAQSQQKKRGRKEKTLFNLVKNNVDITVKSRDRMSDQAKNVL